MDWEEKRNRRMGEKEIIRKERRIKNETKRG
jgi:hypothetical protein